MNPQLVLEGLAASFARGHLGLTLSSLFSLPLPLLLALVHKGPLANLGCTLQPKRKTKSGQRASGLPPKSENGRGFFSLVSIAADYNGRMDAEGGLFWERLSSEWIRVDGGDSVMVSCGQCRMIP